MKDCGLVYGSKAQAKELIIGKDTVYIHSDIEAIEGKENEYKYHEIQYTKDEYIQLIAESGKTIEKTVNELTYNVDENSLTIDELKDYRISISKKLLSDWLSSHPYLHTDNKYYSCTEEKQALLNSNLASYERATNAGIEYPLKWNSTGEQCVAWEYNDLLALSLSIAAYVAPKVSKQQSIEITIKSCETAEELDKVVISYD